MWDAHLKTKYSGDADFVTISRWQSWKWHSNYAANGVANSICIDLIKHQYVCMSLVKCYSHDNPIFIESAG